MKKVCFGCGKGVGDIDVEPTDDVKVWYDLHEECKPSMKFKSDWRVFNENVMKQSKLPKKGDVKPGGER